MKIVACNAVTPDKWCGSTLLGALFREGRLRKLVAEDRRPASDRIPLSLKRRGPRHGEHDAAQGARHFPRARNGDAKRDS